ncbi:titin homolog isoform X2 [Clytia hemisphaerica]|uniref:titin homolog isoform X2 n=1 Tax=Clytia hemisphaerica TaxID=252671 RepID=UPI0034D51337
MAHHFVYFLFVFFCLLRGWCQGYGYQQQYGRRYAPANNNNIYGQNLQRKNDVPKNWVQLYKSLEHKHTPRSSVGGRPLYNNPVITNAPPQFNPRSGAIQPKVPQLSQQKGRFVVDRKNIMDYFYAKQNSRTPKQELRLAQQTIPSLNSLFQKSIYPSILQRHKAKDALQRQVITSKYNMKMKSSINRNLDKKSLIRGPPYYPYYTPYTAAYKNTWYPYQQQRSYVPSSPTFSRNLYAAMGRYASYAVNPNTYRSYYQPTNSNINRFAVKKTIIPRGNIPIQVNPAFIRQTVGQPLVQGYSQPMSIAKNTQPLMQANIQPLTVTKTIQPNTLKPMVNVKNIQPQTKPQPSTLPASNVDPSTTKISGNSTMAITGKGSNAQNTTSVANTNQGNPKQKATSPAKGTKPVTVSSSQASAITSKGNIGNKTSTNQPTVHLRISKQLNTGQKQNSTNVKPIQAAVTPIQQKQKNQGKPLSKSAKLINSTITKSPITSKKTLVLNDKTQYNHTHHKRHFFHKTPRKLSSKREFLSSPDEFADEEGEVPLESNAQAVDETTTDPLAALDDTSQQGELPATQQEASQLSQQQQAIAQQTIQQQSNVAAQLTQQESLQQQDIAQQQQAVARQQPEVGPIEPMQQLVQQDVTQQTPEVSQQALEGAQQVPEMTQQAQEAAHQIPEQAQPSQEIAQPSQEVAQQQEIVEPQEEARQQQSVGRADEPALTEEVSPQETHQHHNEDSLIKSATKVPLLNIDTPDQNDVPDFIKKQIEMAPEHKLSSEFQSGQQAAPGVILNPGAGVASPSSGLNTGEPQSDIESAKADIANLKHLQMKKGTESGGSEVENLQNGGGSKAGKSEEELEAMKEEKEANKMITSKDEDITKLQDRPEVIGLGNNGLTRKVDSKMLNLQTGNLATPGFDQGGSPLMRKMSSNDENTEIINGIHEELRDGEPGEVQQQHLSSPKQATGDPFSKSFGDTEETISKLEQHDYLDSDKIVNTLSTLKEPPDSLALGGSETQRLMKNEEENVKGGLALNTEQPGDQEKAALLDPVKAQERATELAEKADRERQLKTALEKQAREESERENAKINTVEAPKENPKPVPMTPENAMNALDGKPLAHQGKPEDVKDMDKKVENVIEKQQANDVKKVNEIPKEEKVQLQQKSVDEKPAETKSSLSESSSPKPSVKNDTTDTSQQREKVVAENATVSSQVVDVLKGIGQITEKAPKHIDNKTLDNEEKETKEAVSDLNVAIGILEKKISLINQAKSHGEKKNIYLLDGEKKKEDSATSRSQIELNNSIKLLEKVMNVAKRVESKHKEKHADIPTNVLPTNEEQKKKTQRDSIRQPDPFENEITEPYDPDQEEAQYLQQPKEEAPYLPQQQLNPTDETYEILEDGKRDTIYRYPTSTQETDSFIVQDPVKRSRIPNRSFYYQRRNMVPFYRNPYNYQEQSYLSNRRYPYPWYPRY